MIINKSTFCNFIQIEGNKHECSKCGTIITIIDNNSEKPIFPCAAPVLSDFNSNKIIQFMSKHKTEEGLCSEEEINARHNICLSCEHFKNNSCNKCGCALTKNRNYLNKLALKDQNCPINKW